MHSTVSYIFVVNSIGDWTCPLKLNANKVSVVSPTEGYLRYCENVCCS